MFGTTRAAAFARLRSEQGFMSGSIMEVLIVLPILVLIVVAALGFLVTSGRTEARSQARYADVQEAQRGLDRMVRELRRASSIKYLAPTAGYTLPAGVTNQIQVQTVSLRTGLPTTITYICAAFGATYESTCATLYPDGNGAYQWKPALPTEWNFGPNGKLAPGPRLYNPSGATPPPAADTASFGVFHFEQNGADAASPTDATNIKIRMQICARTETCTKVGMKRPITLEADVSPRNATIGMGN